MEKRGDVNRDVTVLVNGARMKTLLDGIRRDWDEIQSISFGEDDSRYVAMLAETVDVLGPSITSALNLLEAYLDLVGVDACLDVGYRE